MNIEHYIIWKNKQTLKNQNTDHDKAILIKVDLDQSHETGISIKEKKDKQRIKNKK